MSKIFALLALLLIATGIVLLAVPKQEPGAAERGLLPDAAAVPVVVIQARELAEQVNAPLSIIFGLVSLFYSRRTYHVSKERAEATKAGKSA